MTFSPIFEETLATIANPPAKGGREAATRLWQESWGPNNYQREHERSKKLRAYGIERLTQCNHEITWRDGGESFTFRENAAPGRGGDEALIDYVAAQRALGWRSGLYTNYTDFAPVNAWWDTDRVMRRSDNNLVTAWPRCYSPKALFAVEADRKLAPLVQRKFGTNAAYTDVHTSVSPWDRTDFDARVPGAGTFAATFYAYGELLLHDQGVYDNHCWSEGNHQWLYAGLCAGNYGLTYSSLRLWEYPYLPHFDLLKMHPLSVDIGVPWTSQFFTGKKDWQKPENIVASIDQFLAATIAYGHIGWLVEETHGMRQTCRSYYMLQPLQSRYAMLKPQEIRYGTDDGLVSSSEAFQSGAGANRSCSSSIRTACASGSTAMPANPGRSPGLPMTCRPSAGSPWAWTASSSVPSRSTGNDTIASARPRASSSTVAARGTASMGSRPRAASPSGGRRRGQAFRSSRSREWTSS